MPIPSNLRKHFSIIEAEHIPLDQLFSIPDTPFKERFLRKYIAPLVLKLPLSLRYTLGNTMKTLRNPSKELRLHYPLDFTNNRILAEKLSPLNLKPWWNHPCVICLCHDVDNTKGAKFVDKMANINKTYNIPSTFNYLTHADYKLDHTLLAELKKDGFEIGLHGFTHDQGFAFRSKNKIAQTIKKALEQIEVYDIKGFRSPALSLSHLLFSQFKQFNIQYDSSLQIASPFYHSVEIPYPVYLEQYNTWELPLMIQDDNYFRDTNSSEEDFFVSLNRFIEETKKLNGVLVINIHPHLMADRPVFYKNFVKWLDNCEGVICKTMGDVVDYVK